MSTSTGRDFFVFLILHCSLPFLEQFSEGHFVAVSTSEGVIHLIDALNGEEKKKVNCKSSGVGHLKYTHHEMCLLVSSEQRSTDVRYLSLYDNKYIRSFQGHQGYISSISMCPTDDHFLTASLDKTVVKWDLSSPNEVARIKLPSSQSVPTVAYDSSGLVFGVMSSSLKDKTQSIRLFDARQTDSGPFQVISPTEQVLTEVLATQFPTLETESKQRAVSSAWTSFQFTSDGSHILVNTDSDVLWLLDGFRPDVAPKAVGVRKNESQQRLGACVSTDCKHILAANDSNEIQVFDANSLDLVTTLTGHLSTIGCIAFNPRYDMFVSGCINTALWIARDESGSNGNGGVNA